MGKRELKQNLVMSSERDLLLLKNRGLEIEREKRLPNGRSRYYLGCECATTESLSSINADPDVLGRREEAHSARYGSRSGD
jgi:hypothetical protein